MAYHKIEEDKKGRLKARIQVSGKDIATGKLKVFVKKVYNDDGLTLAKFKKQVEKYAMEFSEEVARAYEAGQSVGKSARNKVLTVNELASEWLEHIRNNLSINYYLRAKEVVRKFNNYLQVRGLADKEISEITVRDVELFLKQYSGKTVEREPVVMMKQDLPKEVNFRQLARDGILTRCSSYGMRKKGNNILEETAKKVCDIYHLNFDDYFVRQEQQKGYSVETIRGYRRILRTLFNEAVRYDWIAKNPVCATKVTAGNNNSSLREVPEKEVFSRAETKEFLDVLDNRIPEEYIYKKLPLKMMLLTGVRTGEMSGLRWSDVDFEKGVIHVRRNRLASKEFGVYEKDPKTKTSKRDIPMPKELIADLHEYYKWFEEADPNFASRLDDYYLASNIYREPLYPGVLGHWLKDIEREYDLKPVTCHGLRHTYCSLLLSQNVPIQTVSKYMGHSDSTVTLKVYSHFIPDTQDQAMDALSMVMG